jgi:hypothetical protein
MVINDVKANQTMNVIPQLCGKRTGMLKKLYSGNLLPQGIWSLSFIPTSYEIPWSSHTNLWTTAW